MKKKYAFLVVDQSIVVSIGLNGILKNKYNPLLFNETKCIDIQKILRKVKIDLVFLEIIENGEVELSIISEIRKIDSNAKILVFTECSDKKLLSRIRRNLNIHVLEKTASINEIIKKVSTIIDGNSNVKTKRNDSFRLSQRENQIAKMLLDGMRNIEISDQLKLSITTVSTYKYRILKKYKAKNILELQQLYKS